MSWICRGLCENDLKSEQIKLLKPVILRSLINELQMQRVLIFCRSSLDCDLLGQYLNQKDNRICRVLAGSKSTSQLKNERRISYFSTWIFLILLVTDGSFEISFSADYLGTCTRYGSSYLRLLAQPHPRTWLGKRHTKHYVVVVLLR